MISVENVSKTYGGQTALAATSLTPTLGQTTVLIGPSGCGKSTLLRLMVGLIAPDTGRVVIGETPLTPQNVEARRHEIGYVIQDGGLFPHLTAARNVSLLARFLGKAEHRNRGTHGRISTAWCSFPKSRCLAIHRGFRAASGSGSA